MNRLTVVVSIFLLLPIATLGPSQSLAQNRCQDLANLKLTDGTTLTASSIAANTYKPPFDPYEPPPQLMPAFCRVQGIARPTPDSEIRFELWLPTSGFGTATTSRRATAAWPDRFHCPQWPSP